MKRPSNCASLIFAAILASQATLTQAQPAAKRKSPPPAEAAAVYRWLDKAGAVHFGSKPPPDAVDVKPVKAATISRYSSTKVAESFGRVASPKANAGSNVAETTLVEQVPYLEHGDVDVQRGTAGEITACRVAVRNTGLIEASGVTVSFLFPDNTLVPAVGPGTIAAKTEQTYDIPVDQLPLKLRPAAAGNKGDRSAAPQVVLNFEQTTSIPVDDQFKIPVKDAGK